MRICFLPALFAVGPALASSAQTDGAQTMDGAVGRALQSNPAVLAAKQRVMEAQSHVYEVGGQNKPQIVFNGLVSGSAGEVAQPPSRQTFGSIEGSLTYGLPNRRRNGALINQAEAQLEIAGAALSRTLLDVQFRTSEAFIEVLRTREALGIANQNLDQALRQVSDTQKRIAAGDLPAADLLKAQVPEAQSRAAVARAKNAVVLAEQNLNSLLQRNLTDQLVLANPNPPGTAAASAPALVDLAESKSPEVTQAEAGLRGAQANLEAVRHERDPDWSLAATHSVTSDVTAYSNLTTLTLNLSLPVADGGVGRERVHQAQLQIDQAVSGLKLARQQVELDVQQARLTVLDDQANVEATATTLRIAGDSLDKARQAYTAGLTTTRDVLDAQLVYAQARIEANSAIYDLQVAYAHLRQLVGGKLPTG